MLYEIYYLEFCLLSNLNPLYEIIATNFVMQDGDFLVRESQGTAGQYVLTGMQNNTKKHLLLVDPEGVVSRLLFQQSVF